VNKLSIFLETIKNGLLWAITLGIFVDLILFYVLNTTPYVASEISRLGIQPIWLLIGWPILVYTTAAFVTAAQYYKLLDRSNGNSKVLGLTGLNKEWLEATSYLCAVDIMVNKKRKSFGIVSETTDKENKTFRQRFEELIVEIKKRDKDVGKTIEIAAKNMWDIRAPIVHYGRIPKKRELEIIKNSAETIIKSFIEV
jgi:hypothetical protein